MPTPPVVLTVGLVPVLLESRSEVLRSVGYTVIAAGSSQEATNHFVHGKVDLVLCAIQFPVLRGRV
jgi:CheY-like chemotaxis protein